MGVLLRGLFPLIATVALETVGQAYVLIDDFTVGEYSKTLTAGQSDTHRISGLDPNHCIFEERVTAVDINNNPNNTELRLSVGLGRQSLTSPQPISYHFATRYAPNNPVDLDLSQESQFIVELNTVPENFFADQWSILVVDTNGVDASNGSWIGGPDGIRFKVEDFSRTVDWRHIKTLQFQQNNNIMPNPLAYEVTSFYMVPEPGGPLALLGCLLASRANARRSLR